MSLKTSTDAVRGGLCVLIRLLCSWTAGCNRFRLLLGPYPSRSYCAIALSPMWALMPRLIFLPGFCLRRRRRAPLWLLRACGGLSC